MHSQHSLNARLLRFRSQPNSEDAYALAEELIDAGRYADARSVVALAKPPDTDDAALLLLEARAHLLERDLIRAQAALLEAVKVAPSLQPAYRYLGEVLLKRGDPLRAQKTLRRALSLRPDDGDARALLERAEYLAEAANDSLEALPSDLHSDFEADAAQRGVELGSEPPDADGSSTEEERPRVRTDPQFTPTLQTEGRAPPTAAAPSRGPREDEPTSEFQHASHVDPAYNMTASARRRAAHAAAAAPNVDAALPPSSADADFGDSLPPTAVDNASERRRTTADATTARPRPHVETTADAPLSAADRADRRRAARAAAAVSAGLADNPGALPLTDAEIASFSSSVAGRDSGAATAAEDDAVERSSGPEAHLPEQPVRVARARSSKPELPASRASEPEARAWSARAEVDEARESAPAGGMARSAKARPPGSRASEPEARAWSARADVDEARESEPARGMARSAKAPPPGSRASEPEARAWRARADGDEARESEPAGGMARSAKARPPGSRASEPEARAWSARAEVDEAGESELDAREARARGARSAIREDRGAEPEARGARGSERGGAAGGRREGFGKRLSDFRMHPGRATEPPAPGVARAGAVASPPTAAEAAALDQSSFEADAGTLDSAADGGEVDADRALEVVRQLGLFEDPSSQPATWSARGEIETPGRRVPGVLIGLWGVTLALCVAGYFGWHAFVERRHATAARLVEQAHALTFVGDHAALVDAERLLRIAREQHPASLAVTEEALFVQIERLLEDGERDTAALRAAFARATGANISGTSVALASLLLSAASADVTAREHALADILGLAKGDARTLYLMGRAEERMGMEAGAHFEAAARAEPKLIPAQLALAERAYERAERAAALRVLDAALSSAPLQLRVRLFRLLVSAYDVAPDKLRQELNGLAEPLRKGNNMDQALGALVRARLARRSAEPTAALQALESAAQSGAQDARVLGWLAEEALVLGNAALAQQLASRALSLAPDNLRSRRLLARVLIERGAGQQAFVLLASLPKADAEVQVWRAKAALLADDPELLRAALYTLPQASGKKPEPDVEKAALRLRIETRLDPSKAVLDRARALAHAAPTDPDALLALSEAALAQHDAKTAQSALKQRALIVPDDAQAQTLLGRSLRMSGDVDGAEATFRSALSLRPGHADAQSALASLLLDRGKYAEADAMYRELALHDETALSGRLGRVEALIGQDQLADAQVQLEAAPEAARSTPAYREVSAKLALRRGEVAAALKLLGPLSEEQPSRASVRALHAEALLMAAQLSAADDEADAALALDPELPEALLCRAELQLLAKKTKDALATLSKAEAALHERVRPPAHKARMLTLLGRTLLLRKKRGDVEAAVRALREAASQPGAAADVYLFLAEALSGNKDKAGAQDAARRYLELAPSGPYRQRAQRLLGTAR